MKWESQILKRLKQIFIIRPFLTDSYSTNPLSPILRRISFNKPC